MFVSRFVVLGVKFLHMPLAFFEKQHQSDGVGEVGNTKSLVASLGLKSDKSSIKKKLKRRRKRDKGVNVIVSKCLCYIFFLV